MAQCPGAQKAQIRALKCRWVSPAVKRARALRGVGAVGPCDGRGMTADITFHYPEFINLSQSPSLLAPEHLAGAVTLLQSTKGTPS